MLIKQKFIFRSDLQANPDVLYLFGDNNERVGYGGQAKEMRDEPNAVGIRTKWRPGMSYADFFNDSQYEEVVKMFEDDLQRAVEHHEDGGIVIIPADGLGTGLSKLPELAPMCNQALVNLLTANFTPTMAYKRRAKTDDLQDGGPMHAQFLRGAR